MLRPFQQRLPHKKDLFPLDLNKTSTYLFFLPLTVFPQQQNKTVLMKVAFPKGKAVQILSHDGSLWSVMCCQWRKRDSPYIPALLQISITEITLAPVTGPLPLLHPSTEMLVTRWWVACDCVSICQILTHPSAIPLFVWCWLVRLQLFLDVDQLQIFLQNFHVFFILFEHILFKSYCF